MLERLDPEIRKKFENGELGPEDLRGMGLIPDDDEYYDEMFAEEGEDEKDENENGENSE